MTISIMKYNIETFVDSINKVVLNSDDSDHGRVLEIKDIVKSFMQDDGFIIGCIEKLIVGIKKDGASNWKNPPIYIHPENLFSIRCIVWPGYYSNNPHKHNTWSVTAILGNKVNVNTYSWENDIENSTLLLDRRITGQASEVGYLLPGCIHKLSNPSSVPSLTMHVFNNVDKNTYGIGNAIWYPGPEKDNIFENLLPNTLHVFEGVLKNLTHPKVKELLQEVDLLKKSVDYNSLAKQDINSVSKVDNESISSELQKILLLITINKFSLSQFAEWKNEFIEKFELSKHDIIYLEYIKKNYLKQISIMANLLSQRRSNNTKKYLELLFSLLGEVTWDQIWNLYLDAVCLEGMDSLSIESWNFLKFIVEGSKKFNLTPLQSEVVKYEYLKLDVMAKFKQTESNLEKINDYNPYFHGGYLVGTFSLPVTNILSDIKSNKVMNKYEAKEEKLIFFSTYDGLNSVVLEYDVSLLELLQYCDGTRNIDNILKLTTNPLFSKETLLNDVILPLSALRVVYFNSEKMVIRE